MKAQFNSIFSSARYSCTFSSHQTHLRLSSSLTETAFSRIKLSVSLRRLFTLHPSPIELSIAFSMDARGLLPPMLILLVEGRGEATLCWFSLVLLRTLGSCSLDEALLEKFDSKYIERFSRSASILKFGGSEKKHR